MIFWLINLSTKFFDILSKIGSKEIIDNFWFILQYKCYLFNDIMPKNTENNLILILYMKDLNRDNSNMKASLF